MIRVVLQPKQIQNVILRTFLKPSFYLKSIAHLLLETPNLATVRQPTEFKTKGSTVFYTKFKSIVHGMVIRYRKYLF